MEWDNKTIVIIGLIMIAIISLYVGDKDISLSIGSGLVGFLSKDASDYVANYNNETNIIDNNNGKD